MKLNLAVTAIALAGIALATTEANAQTTLYGCYVKNTGTVYRIKTPNAPTKCSGNATEFSWNMEGQVGPQGPQGPQGPAGPSTFPGLSVTTTTTAMVSPGATVDFQATCLPGQRLFTGGYVVGPGMNPAPTDFVVQASEPYFDHGDVPVYGWHVKVKNIGASGGFMVQAVAHCTTILN